MYRSSILMVKQIGIGWAWRKIKKITDDDKDVLHDFTREDKNAQGKSELRRKKALNIITNDERPDYV